MNYQNLRKWPSRCRAKKVLIALLGLGLVHAASAATRTVTQTVAYDYDADGMQTKVITEPYDSNLCLVKDLAPDSYGNVETETLRNCSGATGSVPGVNSEAAAPTGVAGFEARSQTAVFTDPRFKNSEKNALLHEIKYTYNSKFGVRASATDANLRTVKWTQDGFGRPLLQQLPDGNGTTWAYAYCKSVPNGTADCPTVGGRLSAYVTTETPVASVDVDQGTYGAKNGPVVKKYYDAWQRVIRTEVESFADGDWVATEVTFDSSGRLASRSQPFFTSASTKYFTTFTYDELDRPLLESRPDGGYTKKTYDWGGQRVTIENKAVDQATTYSSATQITRITFKGNGFLNSVCDTLAGEIWPPCMWFDRDPLGQPLITEGPESNDYTAKYDVRERILETNDPDLGYRKYSYDALGNLVKVQDEVGVLFNHTYDLLNRIVKTKGPDFTLTWFYDTTYKDGSTCSNAKGSVCEVTSDNGFKRRFTYDSMGRKTAISTKVDKWYDIGLAYNTAGLLETVTYPAGFAVKRVYNGKGQLSKVTSPDGLTTYWAANSLDAFNLVKSQTFGNGVSTTFTRDPKTGNLTSVVAGANGAVQSLSMTYDYLGNVRSRTDSKTGVVAAYDYDDLDRLRLEKRSGGGLTGEQSITWGYDRTGNLTSRSDVGTYTYPPSGAGSFQPHAVSKVTGTVNGVVNPEYFYDNHGNMHTGAGRTFEWMSYDRPSSVTKGTTKLDWLYTPEFERIQERYTKGGVEQRRTVYLNAPGGQGLFYEEETGLNGLKQKNYISVGGGAVAVVVSDGTTNTVQYLHQDGLDSNSVVTNASGGILERLAYEPFGKRRFSDGKTDSNGTLTSTTTDRGFTGHEMLDEIGLINANARLFDPALGRFVSPDPMLQDPSNEQGFNRYSYGVNNPTSTIDPSGFNWLKKKEQFSRRDVFAANQRGGYSSLLSQDTDAAGFVVAGRIGWANGGGGAGSAYGVVAVTGKGSLQKLFEWNHTTFADMGEKVGFFNDWVGEAAVMFPPLLLGRVVEDQLYDMSRQAGGDVTGFDVAMFGVGVVLPGGKSVAAAKPAVRVIGASGKFGEEALAKLGGSPRPVFFRTSTGARYVDRLVGRVAHEAKTGYTTLTREIRRQIAKDAELIRTRAIDRSTWHFFANPETGIGGASRPLIEELEKNGITVILEFHP